MIFHGSILLALAVAAEAHIALFHPSMFGLLGDKPYQEGDYGNHAAVNPLRGMDNLEEDKWFAHGRKKFPPPDGVFMELPTGGVFTGELSCDRDTTTMGYPEHLERNKKTVYACGTPPGMSKGSAIHNNQDTNKPFDMEFFGGTALAIAYTSDINALKPTDLTVISVNYTSPWFKDTDYHIPADMPACPEGGCLCSWNWLHRANHKEGYGSEIYNNVYRCKITGKTNNANKLKVGGGAVPKKCKDKPADCVKGPKQPMYLYQKSGNNMEAVRGEYPTYTSEYGFEDGAQKDLFAASKKRMVFDDEE